jgi:hypothetical protein
VSIDPARTNTGHGAVTIMSITKPAVGANVAVVNGLIVVTRASNFVGSTVFSYDAMGADGTQVHVTVTAHVLGESMAGPSLPFTGANVGLIGLIALVLTGTGIVAMWIGRARTARD